MMAISCIAIDDEPFALQQIEAYIHKVPYLRLAGAYGSALKALGVLDQQPVDLIFLDIQIPDLNGIEFTKALTGKQKIIFTTAYDHYAIEGFKLSAIDYLLKPISFSDFLNAAQKAKDYFDLVHKTAMSGPVDDFLFVKSDYKLKRVNIADILYIEALREYIRIVPEKGEPVSTLMSMKAIEEKLPARHFMRIHRSFIVHLDKIQIVERNRIVFGKVYIPIGEQYKEDFLQYIKRGDSD